MVRAKPKAVGDRLEAKLVTGFFGDAKLDASHSASFADTLSNSPKPSATLQSAFTKYRALVPAASLNL